VAGDREYGPTELSEVRQLDEVDLFLFSAALWLPHRIHYDREYVHTEGHANLLVHGPLQAAIATEMVSRHARASGLRVSHLSYRHVAPAFVNSQLAFSAQARGPGDSGGQFDVTVRDRGTGETTTVGVIDVGPVGPVAPGVLD
jgi:hydroxyacyl-ACP dehydratase HTD2-like protein with hotdog domain